ncbi:unnamed protein product [Bursaphelenchus xylophilus]|uniref:(pine wood nematode) hypothetical protein n=1 Tax=Bursaphelenchus xylophilus TaxID=6326 RepID=A0A1I7RP55_BURXY|nr:unnamed protein product [Bursaphelenchus xylophilus]CAG9124571.1 unnamed protein product [Bursaphelenchus xylophilus]
METKGGQRAAVLLFALWVGTLNAYDDVNDLPFVTTWLNEKARTTFTEKANSERGEYLKSVYEGLDADTKKEVHNNLLPECYSWFLTESQKEELEALHHSGDHERCHKRIADIKAGLTKKQQENIASYWPLCEHVWYHESHSDEGHHDHHAHHHHRRSAEHHVRPVRHVHTSFDDFAAEHLTWLTDAEKTELKALHAGDDPHKSATKLISLFKDASGEKKEKAKAQLLGACRELIVNTLGADKADELKKLKESGAKTEVLSKKVDDWLAAVTDEAKKTKALRFRPVCTQIYELSGYSRKRRHSHGGKHNHKGHHGEHGLEDYLHTYLHWLTDAQKETLREMKVGGSSEAELRLKVLEFFDHTEGDDRERAQEALQEGCRTLISTVIGEENAKLLKKMKKDGSSNAEVYAKIQELLSKIGDQKKVERAQKYSPTCKKAFGISSRARRDHHHHDLESKLKSQWSWLSNEQKDEIRELKKQGKKDDVLLNKVFEYFKALTGSAKSVAEDGLQTSCGGPILTILGTEKAEELKKFMEKGSTPAAYEAKVKELLQANPPKRKLSQTEENCKLVFTQATRKRRHDHQEHHGKHTLEDYLKTHLSWLTEDQKNAIRELKKAGKNRDEIQGQVMKFYKEATGEQKEKATAQLQAGCKELLVAVVGKEKADELKKLKESGATVADVISKAEEFFKAAGESEIAKQAIHYQAHCKEIFGLSRARRSHGNSGHDHHHHDLEAKLKSQWSFLTDKQKDEIRELKKQGKKDDVLLNKVFEYFKALTGSAKTAAEDGLQTSCGGPILTILGTEKAEELKKFMEKGSTPAAYEAKVKELLQANPPKRKLSQTEENCKLVFVEGSKRRRRHDHHAKHDLEDYLKTHLSWLNDAQKEEVRKLKAAGKGRDDIQVKVMEYYEAATGEQKEKATAQLQAGCRELLQHVIGDEKMAELKKFRESGKSLAEVAVKANEFVAAVGETEHVKEAKKYTKQCKSLFGVAARRRRHDLSFINF